MLKKIAKWILYKNPIKILLEDQKNNRELQKDLIAWEEDGKISSPPHLAKQLIIRQYQKKNSAKILIETGTYMGDMVFAMRKQFSHIYSIELSPNLFEKAKLRFSKYNHIEIIRGDSGEVLKDLLPKIKSPALFWLDGHYSGDITAQGNKDTPILEELRHVLSNYDWPHIILIDDARVFGKDKDYPKIDELKEFVLSLRANAKIEVQDDIIRIS